MMSVSISQVNISQVNEAGPVLPALIAGAGDQAVLRFLEHFTVNIRNKNTRAAYAQERYMTQLN